MFGLTVGWQIKLAEWLIVLAIASGVAYWIYSKGYDAAEAHYIVAQKEADDAATKKYNLVADKLEVQKNVRQEDAKVITKVVTKLVTRDVYRNVCIDADGLSAINSALAGVRPSVPDATLPPAKQP